MIPLIGCISPQGGNSAILFFQAFQLNNKLLQGWRFFRNDEYVSGVLHTTSKHRNPVSPVDLMRIS
jgi:hypothetical protein